MAISLIPLPYAENALEPHISAETLKTHHGAHHKTYVDKVNQSIEGSELADRDLEAVIQAAQDKSDRALFNSAAQTWNHGFYWHSLTPERTEPSDGLAKAIQNDFGSAKALNDALIDEAVAHFGSGWAWLVVKNGKLAIISTHDAGTALTEAVIPLLTIDVWEHAYYLDVKNKRPDHVKAVVDHRLNWRFASANYSCQTVWSYPHLLMQDN